MYISFKKKSLQKTNYVSRTTTTIPIFVQNKLGKNEKSAKSIVNQEKIKMFKSNKIFLKVKPECLTIQSNFHGNNGKS